MPRRAGGDFNRGSLPLRRPMFKSSFMAQDQKLKTGKRSEVVVRGPSLCLSSSQALDWKGIAVERHRVEPGEKPELSVSRHFITLASGRRLSYGERRGRGRQSISYLKPPGTMNLNVEGRIPPIIVGSQTEVIVCSLDSGFVQNVAAEQEDRPAVALHDRIGFHDEAVESLVRLIEREARFAGESGSLFLEHLTYSLVLRILSMGRKLSGRRPIALSSPRLKRVIERMEADLAEGVTLEALAEESGYSRNHFLRMFRAATGSTPHRYLQELRIKRAESMIRSGSMRFVDIALACGFSSDGHFSRVFREIMRVSPGEYRRSLRCA